MNKSNNLSFVYLFLIIMILLSFESISSQKYPSSMKDLKFSINLQKADIRDFLEMITQNTGLVYHIPTDLKPQISYSFQEISLLEALEQICRDHQLNCELDGNDIFISDFSNKSNASIKNDGQSLVIHLRYLTAKDVPAKVESLLEKNEKIIVDEPTNSIVILGSKSSYSKIKSVLDKIDVRPPQVLIEGQIVEMRKNKVNDLGISYGDLSNPTLSNVSSGSWIINNPAPSAPNITAKLKIGSVDGRSLEAKIAAAESNGDAKVISRPKVITINNNPATINSGITFNVKTLSATTTTTGSSTTSVTGGIQQITAGLNLQVTPTIVDLDHIRLKINVTSSEPDDSTSVDGIPGIVENSANTSIIVKDGNTATMAGLIKNTYGKNSEGVPLLSKIPLIGWLFKFEHESKRDTELIIFITPKIIRNQLPDRLPSQKDNVE